MLKFCFLVIALLGLTYAYASPQGQRQTTRLEMKGFSVTPTSQNEVQSLIRQRDSFSAKKYFYKGGQMQLGWPVEILIPKYSESEFLREMREGGLQPEVKHERIKMKLYGGNRLSQADRVQNWKPAILSQTCTKKRAGQDCSTGDDCCSGTCEGRGGGRGIIWICA